MISSSLGVGRLGACRAGALRGAGRDDGLPLDAAGAVAIGAGSGAAGVVDGVATGGLDAAAPGSERGGEAGRDAAAPFEVDTRKTRKAARNIVTPIAARIIVARPLLLIVVTAPGATMIAPDGGDQLASMEIRDDGCAGGDHTVGGEDSISFGTRAKGGAVGVATTGAMRAALSSRAKPSTAAM